MTAQVHHIGVKDHQTGIQHGKFRKYPRHDGAVDHGIQHGTALVHTDYHPPLMIPFYPGVKIHPLQYQLFPLSVIILEIFPYGFLYIQIAQAPNRAPAGAVQPPLQRPAHILLQFGHDLLRHLAHDLPGQIQYFPLHHVLQSHDGLQQFPVGLQTAQHFRIREKFRHLIFFQGMTLHNLHGLFGKQFFHLMEPPGHGELRTLAAPPAIFPNLLFLPVFPGIQVIQYFLHTHIIYSAAAVGNLPRGIFAQHQPPSV